MFEWAHSPRHLDLAPGAYIVTAGTYNKEHHFRGDDRLEYLNRMILDLAVQYSWELHAWAVLPNHYHFVACTESPNNLDRYIKHLHSVTAIQANKWDGTPGRKVWFQYWDTRLSDEKAYYTRLRYVMNNPVRHGVVSHAPNYKYCSASWFLRNAKAALVKTVESFDITDVRVPDDYA